jgi:hypothetical protein
MEIIVAVAIYIVAVAAENWITDRAQKVQDEELILSRLAQIAGRRFVGYKC